MNIPPKLTLLDGLRLMSETADPNERKAIMDALYVGRDSSARNPEADESGAQPTTPRAVGLTEREWSALIDDAIANSRAMSHEELRARFEAIRPACELPHEGVPSPEVLAQLRGPQSDDQEQP